MNAEMPAEEAPAAEPEAKAVEENAVSMFEAMTQTDDEDVAAMFETKGKKEKPAEEKPAAPKNGGKKNFSFDMSELIKDAEASVSE